jgi:hypothetical protein
MERLFIQLAEVKQTWAQRIIAVFMPDDVIHPFKRIHQAVNRGFVITRQLCQRGQRQALISRTEAIQ